MGSETLRRILAPVDFSDLSALALRYAGALAKCSGARITALYADAFQPPPYFTEGDLDQLHAQRDGARRSATDYLSGFIAAQLGAETSAEARVFEALPADAIRTAATELPADLIVMGTHGRSGINRLLLGSVTERVLREARIPVLAVRGDREPPAIKRILCPVNDSAAARRALSLALDLAGCLEATVTALHIRERVWRESIEDLCAWVGQTRPNAACTLADMESHGDVAGEALAYAAETSADLLVLGARHRAFVDTTVLGVNTIRMIRHAGIPVLAAF